MLLSDELSAEFSTETQATKRLLERLPEEKLSFRPHPKSMTLGRLATHLAEIPRWGKTIVQNEAYDMSKLDRSRKPLELGSRREILELLDKNEAAFAENVKGKEDAEMLALWKMHVGDEILFELPRVLALRRMVINHTIHHRGQLTVYLRLTDVPVPGVYGPSADEA
jgi:uncharacterized damage-inducible protein DinB